MADRNQTKLRFSIIRSRGGRSTDLFALEQSDRPGRGHKTGTCHSERSIGPGTRCHCPIPSF